MTKYIVVEQDGYIWKADARQIAVNYAENYGETAEEYAEELDYCLNSQWQLRDWFFNNMDPEDIVWEKTALPPKDVGDYPRSNDPNSNWKLVDDIV